MRFHARLHGFHARLHVHSRASARATARTLLGELGLAERGRSLIATYNRGMPAHRDRRALVDDPAVVFLDDPTLGLDLAGRREILEGACARRPSTRGPSRSTSRSCRPSPPRRPPNTPTIDLRVSERRTLDAGGILALAIAVPALLGGLAIVLRVRRRA